MRVIYSKETIGKYRLGVVVCRKSDESDIGHIVGFELNSVSELCISVKWADGHTGGIHPDNVVCLYA